MARSIQKVLGPTMKGTGMGQKEMKMDGRRKKEPEA
jgi:hypothetical protein